MKIDTLIEQQAETLHLMRRMFHALVPNNDVDAIDQPLETMDELNATCDRLKTDKPFRRAMVSHSEAWNFRILKLILIINKPRTLQVLIKHDIFFKCRGNQKSLHDA